MFLDAVSPLDLKVKKTNMSIPPRHIKYNLRNTHVFVGASEPELLLLILPVCTGESSWFKTGEPPPELFPDSEELEELEGSELLPS